MSLSRLQTEVSNGTYVFERPLTIINCATQDKYLVYASCQHCLKGVQVEGNGYYCSVHQWQRVPVYRFALRVLLSEWEGAEIWGVIFDEVATKVLGFDANTYVGMKSDEGGSCHGHHQETCEGHVCELHRVKTGSGRVVIIIAGRQRQRG